MTSICAAAPCETAPPCIDLAFTYPASPEDRERCITVGGLFCDVQHSLFQRWSRRTKAGQCEIKRTAGHGEVCKNDGVTVMEVEKMEKVSLQFRDRPVQSVMQRGESKFVQLSFEAGKGLVKHRAPLALTVIVLTGRVSFTVDEHTQVLESSEMLAVDPGVEHAIEAIERSTVLLVLTPNAAVVEKQTSSAKQPLEHEGLSRAWR